MYNLSDEWKAWTCGIFHETTEISTAVHVDLLHFTGRRELPCFNYALLSIETRSNITLTSALCFGIYSRAYIRVPRSTC